MVQVPFMQHSLEKVKKFRKFSKFSYSFNYVNMAVLLHQDVSHESFMGSADYPEQALY